MNLRLRGTREAAKIELDLPRTYTELTVLKASVNWYGDPSPQVFQTIETIWAVV